MREIDPLNSNLILTLYLMIHVKLLENYTVNIRNNKRLRNWIEPIHYRSTGK
jgi:hypothetical protein